MAPNAAVRTARLRILPVPEPDALESFAEAVRRGLGRRPKTLPCRFFYDAAGSDLFEQICELPEYYLTRAEDAILRDHAGAMIAGWARAPALVELGSGSSSKTRRLIAAAMEEYGALDYVPIDVSPTILETSARALIDDFPRLRVTGLAGDYHRALGDLPGFAGRPRLFAFLGSSLGNYEADEAARLLADVGRAMGPRDRFLLGTDLDKDPTVLEAAYDDARGVTARFNRNLLVRINRELGGDFVPERFDHRAAYRPELRRVEMHLVSRGDQVVRIPGAGVAVHLARGEAIHTENSHKYTPAMLADLAARAGMEEEAAWIDPEGRFRVQRWRLRPAADGR